jgi:hypothetical protein
MQRHPSRPTIRIPVRVVFRVGSGEPREGWIVRLSVAGVDIETERAPPADTRVDLSIEFRPGQPMACCGRVQWSKASGFGAQFTRLGARETHAIVEAMRAA